MTRTALNPIEAFSGYYCLEDIKLAVPRFHRELYELAYSGATRIVISAPRSFAKSIIFSKVYPLYQICQGDKNRILIMSNAGELARHWLREIRSELETNPYILDYGQPDSLGFGVLKTDVWNQDHIICKHPNGRQIEVMAKGSGYQVRGFRPDVIIVDDLEDDEEVASEEQRKKTRNWFDKALINTLEKDAQLIMIGTEIHPLALLREVQQREDWVTRKYQAIMPDGSALWPEKWPIEELEKRRREIGNDAFMSEYMNEPQSSSSPIFYPQWIKTYEHRSAAFDEVASQSLYTIIAVDPAISKLDTSDFTAIVSISATIEDKPKYYVRVGGVRRGHWPLRQTVLELSNLFDTLKANCIVVETVAYQEALADEFRRFQEEQRKYPVVIEVKPDKDKLRRAYAVQGSVMHGDVYFDKSDTMTARLIDEMLLLPDGEHDDLVDAFVYAMTAMQDWAGQHESKGPVQVLPNGVKPSQYTGIA